MTAAPNRGSKSNRLAGCRPPWRSARRASASSRRSTSGCTRRSGGHWRPTRRSPCGGRTNSQPRAYRRFLIQREFLETSGLVGYQCIDTVGEAGREGNGCDCIHAITDLDPRYDRARYPLIFYGQPASRRLVHEAARRQAFIDPWTTHDWLIPAVGLDQYPIDRRDQPYKGIRRPIDPNSGG